MDEILARLWENLGGRVGGPLTFRVILQPLVAGALVVRAGIQDALHTTFRLIQGGSLQLDSGQLGRSSPKFNSVIETYMPQGQLI